MRLLRFRARDFRNLRRLDLELGEGVHVFWGENGQGKTNLLEGVYLLSNLRSFRTNRPADLIGWGAEAATLEGEVRAAAGDVNLRLKLEMRGKIVRVDGKAPETASSYLSEFATVLFSPLDLELAQGNQEMRRSFIDRAAFLATPGHLGALRRFNRALRQRNALLRSGGEALEPWDEEVARTGQAVGRVRSEVAAEIAPTIAELYRDMAAGAEELELRWEAPYLSDGEEGSCGAEGLLGALRAARARDRAAGFTSVGPHRDVLRLLLSGRDLKSYGSRGQQRSAALSFKLALLRWAKEKIGEDPVFLLDDPGSELDSRRLGFLGEFIERWNGQVLIACTDRESFPLPSTARVHSHRVTAGQVE